MDQFQSGFSDLVGNYTQKFRKKMSTTKHYRWDLEIWIAIYSILLIDWTIANHQIQVRSWLNFKQFFCWTLSIRNSFYPCISNSLFLCISNSLFQCSSRISHALVESCWPIAAYITPHLPYRIDPIIPVIHRLLGFCPPPFPPFPTPNFFPSLPHSMDFLPSCMIFSTFNIR